jgi:hypothetical protein
MAKASSQVALDPGPIMVGCMTVKFWDHGGNNIIPEITFAPVGRITPNAIERNLPHIYHQINLHQTQVRNSR